MRVATVKGAAVGASLVYLFDPDRGSQRRALLVSKLAALARLAQTRGGSAKPGIAPSGLLRRITIRLRRRSVESGRPEDLPWDYPMTTVHIDVDDDHAMPGSANDTDALRRSIGEHRGFTREHRIVTAIRPPGDRPK
ncbi:MAG TPA: hypothetical protein VFZ15_05895 [Acidimicrobiia bacterium]|nr:hypothetical protein [Acidimicrobiia bacterium]